MVFPGFKFFRGSMPLDPLVKRGSAATVHRRGVRRSWLLMKTVNGARREVSEMIVFWCCTSGVEKLVS